MKRLSVFLLVFSLMLSVWSPAAHAADGPVLEISSGQVAPGGEVTLTVTVEDNPGVAACLVYIYYDTGVFTVDPAEDISAAGVFRSSGGLIGNTIALARQNGRYGGDPDKDGLLALWYNGSGLDTTGDGGVMTVPLHADPAAAGGSYAVELGYSQEDTCDETGADVVFATAGGTVAVTGGSGGTAPDTEPETPAPDTEAPDPDDGEEDQAQPEPGEDEPALPDDPQPEAGPDSGTEDREPVQETPESVDSGASQPAVQFGDIAGHWAESYITQAAGLGLVEGNNGLYYPDDPMTRAEFVTILWRSAGAPAPEAPATFTDLTQDWYRDAVAWAEDNGVINGVGDGKFDPLGSVTREQLVTILHRMAGTPSGMETMLASVYDGQYPDSGEIGGWARAALYWALYQGIYCGEASVDVGGTLAPRAPASRGQIAVMMVRYLGGQ